MSASKWLRSIVIASLICTPLMSVAQLQNEELGEGFDKQSPEEIEQALMKHPAVAGAICAGIPDPKWGQAPVALVVFHVGRTAAEEELKAFCRDHLADYKVPQHIRPVAELPLTGAGKLNRNAVVMMFS